MPAEMSGRNRSNWWPTTTVPYGWQESGNCHGCDDIDFSFDPYHGKKPTKHQLSIKQEFCDDDCPVRGKCLIFGIETKSTGLFGGEFLDEGKVLK